MLAEDDPAMATMVTDMLEPRGYCVWHATSAAEAEGIVDDARPDLMVLDLILPDVGGLVLCASLQAKTDVPIIICSATKRRDDVILAFKLGADDFIAKPFSPAEFLARAEAVLRRIAPRRLREPASAPGNQSQLGDLTIDPVRCRASLGGQVLHLTPTEYRLVCTLASRPDEVLTREELAQRIWGYHDPDVGRSLDVHMRRLRAKLTAGGVQWPTVVTVRGFGYKIVAGADMELAQAS